MKPDCESVLDWLAGSDEPVPGLAEHARTCCRCGPDVAAADKVRAAFAAWDVTVSPSESVLVARQVLGTPAPTWVPRLERVLLATALAAAAVAVLSISFVPSPQPPTEAALLRRLEASLNPPWSQ